MQTFRGSERGQALILLALGLVAFLGLTALAIDGSMIYSDRRFMQDGMDAAALAGGSAAAYSIREKANEFDPSVSYEGWDCSSSSMEDVKYDALEAAARNASQNNTPIVEDFSHAESQNYVRVVCDPDDKEIVVTTTYTKKTSTSFMHFVYQGDAVNTVSAVTKVIPRQPASAANSLISLDDDLNCTSDKGTVFGGNPEVYLIGGGAYSNSCMIFNSDNLVVAEGGSLNYYHETNFDPAQHTSVSPEPAKVDEQLSFDIPAPDCPVYSDDADDWIDLGNIQTSTTISPGDYKTIKIVNGDATLTMEPGLYCINDGDFVTSGGKVDGEGVTIYIHEGVFDTTGNSGVNLVAPPLDCGPIEGDYAGGCPAAMPGMLIYAPPSNTSAFKINGNAESTWSGTIYAPGSEVTINGTSDTTGEGETTETPIVYVGIQVIADEIKLEGNAILRIEYDGSAIYNNPSKLWLDK